MMRAILICVVTTAAFVSPAFGHTGLGSAASVAAGVAHPFSGLDHISVMLAVGLWAALKGDRALWIWPMTFIGVMLVGAILGSARVVVPFVEPGILASVVTLGLIVTLAIDLPVAVGAAVLATFALLHGRAHGTEMMSTLRGLEYMVGFVVATATLHALGIGFALTLQRAALRPVVRLTGLACIAFGLGWFNGVLE